jgi:hypothetical protein
MGPDIPPPTNPGLTPEQQAEQRQAKLDQIDALQTRAGDLTSSLLARFGRTRSLASAGAGGAAAPAANLFSPGPGFGQRSTRLNLGGL